MLCEPGQGTLIPALSGKPNSGTRSGERTLNICYVSEVHSCVRAVDLESVGWGGCGSVAYWIMHLVLFMLYYFVERHGGVKGDEKDDVAIRVDKEPMLG